MILMLSNCTSRSSILTTHRSPSKNPHRTTSSVADGLPQPSTRDQSRANDGSSAHVEVVASTSQRLTSTTMLTCTTPHQRTPSRHTPQAAAQSPLASLMARAMPNVKYRARKHRLRYHYQSLQSPASLEVGDDQASGHNLLLHPLCQANLEHHRHRASRPDQKSQQQGPRSPANPEPQVQSLPVAHSVLEMHSRTTRRMEDSGPRILDPTPTRKACPPKCAMHSKTPPNPAMNAA